MVQKPDQRRFGAQRQPPSLASKSAQQRLIFLVAMLVFVLILMQQAAQPEMWQWLWRDAPNPAGSSPIDSQPTMAPDQIQLPFDQVDSEEPEATEVSSDFFDQVENVEEVEDGFSGLAEVRDDTYFRKAESPVWFQIYRKLQATPLETLEQLGSESPVNYLQLYRQMNAYRGELVSLSGLVRRAQRVPAVSNEEGIDSHWQLWLFEDEQADSPIVVYALNLPEGFPEGDGIKEPVNISGYAFKRWAYPAQGGLMVAPVMLAKQPSWTPAAPAEPNSQTSSSQIGILVAAGVFLSFMVVRFLSRVPARPARLPIKRRSTNDTPPNFEFLADKDEEGAS